MPTYYEIDVTLAGIRPKIWRRFHFPASARLSELSDAIQDCGPWDGMHLWHFHNGQRRAYKVIAEMKYPGKEEDPFWGEPAPDAHRVRLNDVLTKKGDKCYYEYDFGDSWHHEIKLRKVFESDENIVRRLIDGARNFPPEDSGGVYGYYLCLVVKGYDWPEPEHPPHPEEIEERKEWVGDWDPEAFDLERLKAMFDKVKRPVAAAVKRKKAT